MLSTTPVLRETPMTSIGVHTNVPTTTSSILFCDVNKDKAHSTKHVGIALCYSHGSTELLTRDHAISFVLFTRDHANSNCLNFSHADSLCA